MEKITIKVSDEQARLIRRCATIEDMSVENWILSALRPEIVYNAENRDCAGFEGDEVEWAFRSVPKPAGVI
jgi:hypothetical protein